MARKATPVVPGEEQIAAEAPEAKVIGDPGEEYVNVFIPKDMRIQGDDTVHMSVNGEECHIKPGNNVRIKRKFAEVYQNTMRSDMAAQAYIEQITSNNLQG